MSKTLSATSTRAPIPACGSAMPGGLTSTRVPSGTPESSERSPGYVEPTRRRSTQRVIDAAERTVVGRAGVSQPSNVLAKPPTALDVTSQASIPQDPVLAFDSVDERFIDFLVEEALNEWRAKNF
jgi:hypothetical protein